MGYNGFNQMVSAYSGGKQAQYHYRPDGMRHSKIVDGATTIHLWDGQNIVADTDGAGAVASTYLRGINLIAAKGAKSNHKFYLYNAHGDVVQLADDSGAILWQYDYDAFGVQKAIEGQDAATDTNPFCYCGEYFDRETDTVYLRARYYDPVIGRFMAEDSIQDGLNWYTYCAGNPVRLVDPSGLASVNISDYARVMGADVREYSYNGQSRVIINYGGISQHYILNSGKIDDARLNKKFGWSASASSNSNAVSHTSSLPKSGVPNSKDTLYNPDGTPKKDRWYGPDGEAKRDRDHNHSGKMPFPHDHIWENGKRGKDHLPPDPTYKIAWNPDWGSVEKTALVGLGAAGAGYVVYRGIRMLPSLAPPLWWTIPANVAIS